MSGTRWKSAPSVDGSAPMSPQPSLLSVLVHFSRTLVEQFDVTDVLYELSDSVVVVLGAAGAGVSLSDGDGHLHYATSTNEAVTRVEVVQEHSGGPCQRAFETGDVTLVEDLGSNAEPRWAEYRAIAATEGFRSVAGIPMTAGERRIGALNIYETRTRRWSDDDIAIARVLADIATSYVVHATALDEAHAVNAQLQHAIDGRVLIEQAKGLLAGERRISIDQALAVLRRHARNNNVKLRSVADAVVNLGLRPDNDS